MALQIAFAVLILTAALWFVGPMIVTIWRYCHMTRLVSIKGVFYVPDTIEDPSKVTDLLAFGIFSNPASQRLLASSEYTVVITNHADGSAVSPVAADTTIDHPGIEVNGVAEDVPIGSPVWQTPKEAYGVELDAVFSAPGPNGSVITDDETYTFTGGTPILVGLAGVSVQE